MDVDVVVTDTTTGFIWMFISSIPSGNLQYALDFCESLNYAGYTDWRLPNINELISIHDPLLRPALSLPDGIDSMTGIIGALDQLLPASSHLREKIGGRNLYQTLFGVFPESLIIATDDLYDNAPYSIGGDNVKKISCVRGGNISGVRSVVAGMQEGRRRDAHMNFLRAGFPEHPHDVGAGGAAHDGVVNQDNAFVPNGFLHGGKLYLYGVHPPGGLDERATDVFVFDEPDAVGNAGGSGVADGRVESRVRNADDYVGIRGMGKSENLAGTQSCRMHGDTVDDGVRSRKINIFKDTVSHRGGSAVLLP